MIKMGFLSAILDGWSFEEVVDIASQNDFYYIEMACWPNGGKERRYAGVSHIDVNKVIEDENYKNYIINYVKERNVKISSLAYYPNVLDANMEKRNACISHLKNVIKASSLLNVNMVTTFIGKDQYKTLDENYALMEEVWPDIIKLAESLKVRIAIENCPMLFGKDQWPGGQNLMCTPVIYREVFRRLPSDYLGLNFDPSHYVWQQLDYIKTIYEFKDKLFHIHYKDIKMYPDKLKENGVLAYPLSYMSPKIPGLGDVKWNEFISALTDVGYNGPSVIEVEDKAFESSKEDIIYSLLQSKRYLNQFIK